MKEVTYEEWQKNPTPRMMWVWNSKVEDRLKRMVLFLTERNPSHPVVVLTSDNITTANYKHCAEIEKPRRMTNNEWHYVKDELPDEGTYLVVWQNDKGYKEIFILNYEEDDEEELHWVDDDCEVQDEYVIAWKEIVLPKEVKQND